jgi:hypothetical protein
MRNPSVRRLDRLSWVSWVRRDVRFADETVDGPRILWKVRGDGGRREEVRTVALQPGSPADREFERLTEARDVGNLSLFFVPSSPLPHFPLR